MEVRRLLGPWRHGKDAVIIRILVGAERHREQPTPGRVTEYKFVPVRPPDLQRECCRLRKRKLVAIDDERRELRLEELVRNSRPAGRAMAGWAGCHKMGKKMGDDETRESRGARQETRYLRGGVVVAGD